MTTPSIHTSSMQSLPGPDDTLRQTLPNGITVLARENFASPAVVVSGYVEAGSEDEPWERRGLASFAADVMERGTLHRTFGVLYEEVESIGATFGLSAGAHLISFGAKALSEYLPLLLDILSDVLRYPSFEPRQVEKTRAEILTDLQEQAQDTRRMARRVFYELAYPEAHPYHWNQLGYPETISAITPADLMAFHETYVAPRGMVIVIVGGIAADKALKAVVDAFGDWDKERPARQPLPPVPRLTERRERRVPLRDKSQSSVVLGWPGPSRRHPNYIPCVVTNTILGVFGMYGRLGQRVREENGLAYYVNSWLVGGTGPGPWWVTAGLDPRAVERGIALILGEIRAMCEEGVSAEELEDAILYLTGSLPLSMETNEGVAQSLLHIERYGLGLDYLRRYNMILKSVTVDQVRAMAQQWLDVERFALVVAGPEEE